MTSFSALSVKLFTAVLFSPATLGAELCSDLPPMVASCLAYAPGVTCACALQCNKSLHGRALNERLYDVGTSSRQSWPQYSAGVNRLASRTSQQTFSPPRSRSSYVLPASLCIPSCQSGMRRVHDIRGLFVHVCVRAACALHMLCFVHERCMQSPLSCTCLLRSIDACSAGFRHRWSDSSKASNTCCIAFCWESLACVHSGPHWCTDINDCCIFRQVSTGQLFSCTVG